MTHQVSGQLRGVLAVVAGVVALGLSSTAKADGSPWVLPEWTTVLQVDYVTERADREFLPTGRNQAFPLNGRYQGQTVNFTLRQGFGSGFEASVSAGYRLLTYKSDTVFVADDDGNQLTPAFSFSNSVEGLGDVYIAGRYNAYGGPVVITPEIELKLPTGYNQPAGTFKDDDPGIDPDNPATVGIVPIEDDLALGDGQVDITMSLLVGTFVSATKSFAKASAGFRLRFNGPGQQVIWTGKIGQLIGPYVAVFAGTSGAAVVLEGDPIGQSFGTLQPETPAMGFPLSAFEIFELTQDKEFIDVSGGAILRLTPYEIVLSGGKIVDGENITESIFASLTTVYKF